MPDLFVAPDTKAPATTQPADSVPAVASVPPVQPQIQGHNIGMFATYAEFPKNIAFQNQEPDEVILLFMRRDFITNVPWITLSIVLVLLPPLLMFLLNSTNATIFSIPMNFLLILLAFYYLIVATYAFVNFIVWYYNASMITNKRVVDIDFADLVYRNVAQTKLSLVQDVSYTQVGVIQAVFDFGDVLIQTAAALDNFKLETVPRPQRAVQVTEDLIGKKSL